MTSKLLLSQPVTPKSKDFLDPEVLYNFAELHGKDSDFTSTLKLQYDLGKPLFRDSKSSIDILKI